MPMSRGLRTLEVTEGATDHPQVDVRQSARRDISRSVSRISERSLCEPERTGVFSDTPPGIPPWPGERALTAASREGPPGERREMPPQGAGCARFRAPRAPNEGQRRSSRRSMDLLDQRSGRGANA
mgnify:CR=1 FL=1